MRRIEMMGCPLDVASMEETINVIDDAIAKKQFVQHVVVNVAKLVNMQKNEHLSASIRESNIINIDGMGLVLGARLLGHKVHERVAGIDLFFELIKLSEKKNYSIFLLGSENDVIKKTVEKLHKSYPNLKIAGYNHGFFWENEISIVEKISKSSAQLLFVAITSPKKENFINKWKEKLGVTFVMGVGGTFDIVAGKIKRAPMWMQKYGLEWLFRIIQEPRRMWKRYLVTNTKFAYMLIKHEINNH